MHFLILEFRARSFPFLAHRMTKSPLATTPYCEPFPSLRLIILPVRAELENDRISKAGAYKSS